MPRPSLTAVLSLSRMSLLPGAKRAAHQQELAPLSWYWEPEEVTEQLLREITFCGPVHDPCCGSGRIPILARRFGYEATGSDIVDRGFGVGGVDFFTDSTPRVTLIFNPPAGRNQDPTLSTRFILHALEVAEEVAAVLPVPMQCGQWRRDNLYRPHPPRYVLALAARPSMPPGGTDIEAKGGTMDYNWIVWNRGYRGPTEWRSV
jgi:hypothetical protein